MQPAAAGCPHPMAAEGPGQIRAQAPLEASTLAIVKAPSGSTVNLRAGARKRARLLTQVPLGATVEVLQPGPRWTKVKYDSRTGYMMTEFLTTEKGKVDKIETGQQSKHRKTM